MHGVGGLLSKSAMAEISAAVGEAGLFCSTPECESSSAIACDSKTQAD